MILELYVPITYIHTYIVMRNQFLYVHNLQFCGFVEIQSEFSVVIVNFGLCNEDVQNVD